MYLIIYLIKANCMIPHTVCRQSGRQLGSTEWAQGKMKRGAGKMMKLVGIKNREGESIRNAIDLWPDFAVGLIKSGSLGNLLRANLENFQAC